MSAYRDTSTVMRICQLRPQISTVIDVYWRTHIHLSYYEYLSVKSTHLNCRGCLFSGMPFKTVIPIPLYLTEVTFTPVIGLRGNRVHIGLETLLMQQTESLSRVDYSRDHSDKGWWACYKWQKAFHTFLCCLFVWVCMCVVIINGFLIIIACR